MFIDEMQDNRLGETKLELLGQVRYQSRRTGLVTRMAAEASANLLLSVHHSNIPFIFGTRSKIAHLPAQIKRISSNLKLNLNNLKIIVN